MRILGDGGPAEMAQLCNPAETLFDSSGGLLIADYGNRRVRKIATDGTITTIAGNGKIDPGLSFAGSSGDGGPKSTRHFTWWAASHSTQPEFVRE